MTSYFWSCCLFTGQIRLLSLEGHARDNKDKYRKLDYLNFCASFDLAVRVQSNKFNMTTNMWLVGYDSIRERRNKGARQNSSKYKKEGKERETYEQQNPKASSPDQRTTVSCVLELLCKCYAVNLILRAFDIKTELSHLWACAVWWLRGQHIGLDVTFNHGDVLQPSRLC